MKKTRRHISMDAECENSYTEQDESEECVQPSMLSRMALNDNKAGMEGLDKEKINKIIHENSVGSRFYENEKKKDAMVDERIKKLLIQMQQITPEQLDAALGQTNAIIEELERSRDLSKTIIHIDMDAFYASVEERDNPELKNKPMAVGGMGMLSTSNYVARKYGVRAAMPGFIGKKLCPELILVPLNFAKYRKVSNEVREILTNYDPNFSPMGLDEAYLDITQYLGKRMAMPKGERTFSHPISSDVDAEEFITFGTSVQEVVKEIRYRIEQQTKLTASAGIAPNTLLAKVASDMRKPNGQFLLEFSREKVLEFIRGLSIRKISGIGKVTEKLLNAIGIQTCADLFEKRALLFLLFSNTMSNYFLRISVGVGSTVLENDSERKSISTERTFQDISNPDLMYVKCEEICDALAADATRAGVQGYTVTLKIKLATFELYTRSKTLLQPVSSTSEVYPIVADLLRQELALKKHMSLRLIGVGLSKLTKGHLGGQKQKSLEYFMNKPSQKKQIISESKNTSRHQKIDVEPICSHSNMDNPTFHTLLSRNTAKEGSVNSKDFEPTKAECAKDLPISDSMLDDLKSMSKRVSENSLSCQDVSAPVSESSAENSGKTVSDMCAVECADNVAFSTNEKLPRLDKLSQPCHHAEVQEQVNNNTVNVSTDSSSSKHNNIFSMSDEVENLSCMTCPVCNATFCAQDVTLTKFNDHLDSCLNRKTIRELVKSESKMHPPQTMSTSRKRKKNQKSPVPKKNNKPLGTIDMYLTK